MYLFKNQMKEFKKLLKRNSQTPILKTQEYYQGSFLFGEAFIQKAKNETLDTLYLKVKSIWIKYIDADNFHLVICAADTIFTYFQDRVGLTHYLFKLVDFPEVPLPTKKR